MSTRIYKITNDINDKVYVGKTCLTIEQRFKQHYLDSFHRDRECRPLYEAFHKYGIEHFKISLIEQCPDILANEREQYWIGYYHGYDKGYNATLGGDGSFRYNHDEIIDLIKQQKTTKEISEKIGCTEDWIRDIAKANGLKIYQKQFGNRTIKAVKQFDKKTGDFLREFDSVANAARWVFEQGYASTLNGGTRTNICNVCSGKRKSAYTFVWRYSEEI